ncbi:MAG: ABC transporter permease [Chloracidobacterium sp.]|nr:ABC transporter permease [Chloracidobacterium sp.]
MFQDLRYGARMLLKHPGFTCVAALTLALGIGANTAIFSLIDAVLLKTLPVDNPERLVLLGRALRGKTVAQFPYRAYKQIRDQNGVLSGLLAYHPLRLSVSVDNQPEPAVAGQLVSGNYYSVLGVNAALGRTIGPDDDRAPGESFVCVISYSYWGRRFASDPAVVGKTIHIGGAPFTIIGVSSPEFFGLEVGSSMDISVPLMMQQQVMPGIGSYVDGANPNNFFSVMGRLRPGLTTPQAQAGLSALYRQLCAEYAASNWGFKFTPMPWLEEKLVLESGSRGLSELRRQFSRSLLALMIVVALVLAVACANVAGLLLARAVARRKEIAIRLALGVGRFRLVRQLLTESVLLSSLGALLGLLFAYWGTSLLLPLLSQGEIPVQLNLSPNVRMLGFTIVVATLTGLLFGLAPAFLAARVDMNSAIKNEASGLSGHGAHLTFGKIFVVSQVALSLLLLIGAGLFVRSLQKLRQVDAGFASENVLVLKLEPVGSDQKTPQLAARYDELLRRVEALPGVKLASLIGYSPMSRREWLVMGQTPEFGNPMRIQGYAPQSGEEMFIPWMQIYPNSFATLGIPLLAGRDFGPQDSRQWRPANVCPPSARAPQVGIINESMARRFFGNENPIGRRFGFFNSVGRCAGASEPEPGSEVEIIGVVKDVKYASLRSEGRAMFYLPFYQATTGRGQMTLIVRTAGDPTSVAAAVRREARALDPAMPMFEAETLATQVAASLQRERLLATLSSGFGLLALLLSCLGLYGILSYAVARRTNEIGVRMALGADRRDVLWLVLRDALRLVLIGAALGVPAALVAARLVASQLFGISAADPGAVMAATLALLAVATLASYLPARRATRVDPLVALRVE